MRAMVLNNGETYTGVEGCMIVELPDGLDGDAVDAVIEALCAYAPPKEIERILADENIDGTAEILYTFKGEEVEGK